MPRKSREDELGCLLHLFNRGVARRSVFECREDVRFISSRLAREHRRGRLRIHAFVMLLNHFHLFVESPKGQASEAMRVIQNEYVRWFNRKRRRDGPLFRGRFGSRRVRSEAYWWTLVRYIDLHSEKARITASAGLYPYGSAYHYLTGDGPKWLARERIEAMVTQGLESYTAESYARMLQRPLRAAELELVTLRMRGVPCTEDPLDDLLTSGPSGVLSWMIDKAGNADGTKPGVAVASPSSLIALVAGHRAAEPCWLVPSGQRRRNGWDLLLTGLLRDACGLSCSAISPHVAATLSGVHARLQTHRKLLGECREYGELAASILDEALSELLPPWRQGQEWPGLEPAVWRPGLEELP